MREVLSFQALPFVPTNNQAKPLSFATRRSGGLKPKFQKTAEKITSGLPGPPVVSGRHHCPFYRKKSRGHSRDGVTAEGVPAPAGPCARPWCTQGPDNREEEALL